jgi:hypothetical protein
MIADNIGANIPQWSAFDPGPVTGQKLLDAFDEYCIHVQIDPADAETIRQDIRDLWFFALA